MQSRIVSVLSLVSLVSVLTLACSSEQRAGAGGPSSIRANAPTSERATQAAIDTSAHPGTGTNPGVGAGNSCTNQQPPALRDIAPHLDVLKTEADFIAGQTRGYVWRATRRDASKTLITLPLISTEGRELSVRDPLTKGFEPGPHWFLEYAARFVKCGQAEVAGTWSVPKEFTMDGDANNDSTRRYYHPPFYDPRAE